MFTLCTGKGQRLRELYKPLFQVNSQATILEFCQHCLSFFINILMFKNIACMLSLFINDKNILFKKQ